MYGMGQVPTILQGAATRERLTPDQLARLQAQGIPVTTASGQMAPVNVRSVLPMLLVGIVAAWFLAGGTKRRTLFGYILPLLCVPSMLWGQTWQQQMVSGADTFTVFGRYGTTTTTTVTVDSIVKKQPAVLLGMFYGPSQLDQKNPPLAPFTGSGGVAAGTPQLLLDRIAWARSNKTPVIVNLPCGGHNPDNPGKCLTLKNGVLTFSMIGFDTALAIYNTPTIKAALAQAVKDSAVIAVNLMDEPWVTGSGDGNTWGPNGVSRATTDTLCQKAKNVFGPTVPVGTSDQTKWQRTGTWKVCDIGIAQFSFRYGAPVAWRDSILAISTAQKYGTVFSINWINGGTQDRNGAWDCPGGVKGNRAPNCQMTPQQIQQTGVEIGPKGCGVFNMWRYDQARMALAGYASAFLNVATGLGKAPRKLCGVRQ